MGSTGVVYTADMGDSVYVKCKSKLSLPSWGCERVAI